MKLRIRQIRQSLRMTVAQLAEAVDKSPSYLSMLERGAHGKRPSSQLLNEIAGALGVQAGALFDDGQPVPVVGRVGAGAEVMLVDAYAKGEGMFHVAAPTDLNAAKIVAVEVVGESMLPLIEPGDIIFFTRYFEGIDERAMNRVAIVCTDDGRALVKQVKQGREAGTFDLYSVNPTFAPEYGVRLEWAAPWRRLISGRDVERIDPTEV